MSPPWPRVQSVKPGDLWANGVGMGDMGHMGLRTETGTIVCCSVRSSFRHSDAFFWSGWGREEDLSRRDICPSTPFGRGFCCCSCCCCRCLEILCYYGNYSYTTLAASMAFLARRQLGMSAVATPSPTPLTIRSTVCMFVCGTDFYPRFPQIRERQAGNSHSPPPPPSLTALQLQTF